MSYSQDGNKRSFPAGVDLSGLQYTAVVLDSAGLLQANVTAGGRILGILQDDPKASSAGTVRIRDVSKAVAGAATAIGALLMSNTTGRLITATSTNYVVGRGYLGGANGRIISAELFSGQALL